MPVRGFVSAIYVTDNGRQFRVRVDADSAADDARGWVTDSADDFSGLPRGFLPRRVIGIDETGRQQEARIGTVTAALWTGAATAFAVEGTDGNTYVATVTVLQQEREM